MFWWPAACRNTLTNIYSRGGGATRNNCVVCVYVKVLRNVATKVGHFFFPRAPNFNFHIFQRDARLTHTTQNQKYGQLP